MQYIAIGFLLLLTAINVKITLINIRCYIRDRTERDSFFDFLKKIIDDMSDIIKTLEEDMGKHEASSNKEDKEANGYK